MLLYHILNAISTKLNNMVCIQTHIALKYVSSILNNDIWYGTVLSIIMNISASKNFFFVDFHTLCPFLINAFLIQASSFLATIHISEFYV